MERVIADNARMVAPRSPPPDVARAGQGAVGQVRIIGGRWRGSRLPVAASAGLRPTADRVRETLFNWLAAALPGSHCVDLFAGSGALGLEAASRGAAKVSLIERDARLAASLRATLSRLHGADVEIHCDDALAWLAHLPANAAPIDIAFVDPPFALDLWEPTLRALQPRIAADAWIYLESGRDLALALPPGWRVHREGQTRDVVYRLLRAEAAMMA